MKSKKKTFPDAEFTRGELTNMRFWLQTGGAKEAIFHKIPKLTDELYDVLTVDKITELLNDEDATIFIPYMRKTNVTTK